MSSEWRIVRLGDVSNIRRGSSPRPIVDYMAPSGMPWVKISDATETKSRFIKKTNEFIKFEGVARSVIVKEGDLILSNSGTAGLPKFMAITACVHDGWQFFSDLNGIDKDFLYYTLLNIRCDLLHNAHDSTMKNLTLDMVRDAKVNLPPLIMQKKISRVLTSLDEKIELNHQINQTLEQMAQAIFQSWFVDFEPVKAKISAREDWLARQAAQSDAHDDAPQFSSPVCYAHEFADAAAPAPATQADLETFMNRAAMCAISGKTDADLDAMPAADYQRLYHTASLFPDELIESELGDIPKGWAVVKIDDRYDVVMGQSPSGDSYNEEGEGVLFYQGRAEFGWRFPTPRLYTTEPKRMANKGDILMSVRAPVGDMNISLDDCCIGRGLCAIRHKSGCTSFSYYSLLSVKNILERFNGEGTVFGSINQKDLKALSIVEPEYYLISEFSNSISVIDDFIEEKSAEILSLTNLRDLLLPKLLSGELDISALTDLADHAAEPGAAHV